jgi:hypothetical protein
MNSTPAASRAVRMADMLFVIGTVAPLSKFRSVVTETVAKVAS